jgi:hypothetical protein
MQEIVFSYRELFSFEGINFSFLFFVLVLFGMGVFAVFFARSLWRSMFLVNTDNIKKDDESTGNSKAKTLYFFRLIYGVSFLVALIFFIASLFPIGGISFFMKDSHREVPNGIGDRVVLGESTNILHEEDISYGDVLGDSDTPLPSGEKYQLGQISIGGDSEMYFPQQNSLSLEIFDLSYRVITVNGGEKTSLLIEWKTSKAFKGSVLYKKHSEEDFRIQKEEGFNVEHSILLEDISPETTYIFFVSGEDAWGQKKESDQYAMYSGEQVASLFDLLEEAFGDVFGWVIRK